MRFLRSSTSAALFTLLIAVMSSGTLEAVTLDFRGYLETYHAVRTQAPFDFMISRNRLRMEVFSSVDSALFLVSFDLNHNRVLPEESGVRLREAYLEYRGRGWDLRVGRQIVVWGKADGIQILDIVSPMDLSEFLTQDFIDIRIPVEAVKFRLLGTRVNLELIWLPGFSPAVFAPPESPWTPELEFPDSLTVNVNDPVLPDKKLSGSEFFGKLAMNLPGFDLALSGFYTWDDYGVFRRTLSSGPEGDILDMQLEYFRVWGAGIEFAIPVKTFVLRGEVAFAGGRRFEAGDIALPDIEKNTIDYIVGVDWMPGSNWLISLQVTDQYILEHESAIEQGPHNVLMTLNISKRFFRETLSVMNYSYVGITDRGLFNHFRLDYALTDELHVVSGVDILSGKKGIFGLFRGNSQVFLGFKYIF